MSTQKQQAVFLSFQDRFPNEESCVKQLISLRWPDGFQCSSCGHAKAVFRSEQKIMQCYRCKKAHSITAGTLLHGTQVPFRKWFACLFLMLRFKTRISVRELQTQLGIGSLQTIWTMSFKIRQAMQDKKQLELLERLIGMWTQVEDDAMTSSEPKQVNEGIQKADLVEDKKHLMKPEIFDYVDYRLFLADLCKYLKTNTRYFSFRYFAKQAGFKSSNFLKMIIDGKRNLNEESAQKVIKGFKFSQLEARAFEALVQLSRIANQPENQQEKKKYLEIIGQYRLTKQQLLLKLAQKNYWLKWYYVAIRELMTLEGFREDYEWIAKMLSPVITPQEAKEATESLNRLGMIRRNQEGKLELVEGVVQASSPAMRIHLIRYHKEMIKKGSESIDRFESSERQVTSATIGLSLEAFQELKEMIEEFKMRAFSKSHQSKKERIYQLNFQLFPISAISSVTPGHGSPLE